MGKKIKKDEPEKTIPAMEVEGDFAAIHIDIDLEGEGIHAMRLKTTGDIKPMRLVWAELDNVEQKAIGDLVDSALIRLGAKT